MGPAYSRTAPSMALEMICPECGGKFDVTHHSQLFCTPSHGITYNNRQLGRGQSLVSLAQTWRGGRSSKEAATRQASKTAFSELASLADRFNAEDKAAGRPPATELFLRRRARWLQK